MRTAKHALCALATTLSCAVSLPDAKGQANCANTSTGLIPITDLGAGLYLGQFQGGLYPGGANVPPPGHEAEGLLRAAGIAPLNASGRPDPLGRFVLLSIGMSNTTQEFCSAGGGEPCTSWSFKGSADVHPLVNHTTLEIINGARGGQTIADWDQPDDFNYDRVRDQVLAPQGLTEAQVQVLWIKQAIPGPSASLPAANADAYNVLTGMGDLLRAAKLRYPNAKLAFLSSRIYAGYASTGLNPEPYAYETGFGMKWLIEAQINQANGGGVDPRAGDLDYNSAVPWLAWGPYLWADGTTPRSDGLTYDCADLEQGDGTHPGVGAETKVGAMLLEFMLTSPFTQPWFTSTAGTGDCDASGSETLADYGVFAGCLAGPGAGEGSGCACADLDADDHVTLRDFVLLQRVFDLPPVVNDPAFDDFERAALGPNWEVQLGSAAIIGGSDLGVLTSGQSRAAWVGSTFGADQFCSGVLAPDFGGTGSFQLTVRMTSGVSGGYSLRYPTGGGSLQLRREAGGVDGSALLATASGVTLAPGDEVRIEVEGITIRGLLNNAVLLTANDPVLSGGGPAITFLIGTGPSAFFESWSGGSVNP